MHRRARALLRVTLTGALVVSAVAVGLEISSDGGRVAQAATCLDPNELGAGGEFHELDPVRILDTRAGTAAPGIKGRQPISPDPAVTFDVDVVDAVVGDQHVFAGGFTDTDDDGFDDTVLAVAVNVTVVTPTNYGFLQVFGTGETAGTSALVTYNPGDTMPNSGIVRPGRDGKLTIYLGSGGAGDADVVIDLFGYFTTSGGEPGARIVPAGPGRIYDSREAEFGGAPLSGGTSTKIPIRGADAFDPAIADVVPASDTVTAALVNISVVNDLPGSTPTFVSALPAPLAAGEAAGTANLNVYQGQFQTKLALVPVGPDGAIYLYQGLGQAHLIVDLVGYAQTGFDATSTTGRIVPLRVPYRAFDTRESDHGARRLESAQAEIWSFEAFIDDVNIDGTCVGDQIGVLGNLTATDLTRQFAWNPVSSYLTAYPPAAKVPTVANLVTREGLTPGNLALLKFGADATDTRCADPVCVQFYNAAGGVHYILDVSAVVLA